MEKRGLSDIITTIMLILIILISISIVWLFIKPSIEKVVGSGREGETGEVDKLTGCLDNRLEVSQCGQLESGNYEVRVKRGTGDELKEIAFKFETRAGAITIKNDSNLPKEFGSSEYEFNLSLYTGATIDGVDVAAILADGNACGFTGISKSCGEVITQEEYCGDDKINGNELCDGIDLGEETCGSLGYESGTLSCNLDCTFNTTRCIDGGGQLRTDEDYLLNAEVSVFLVDGKETFTVDYQGKRLRSNYSDEKFFDDKSSGNLIISYIILEKKGGVDIVYTVNNPTQSAYRVPDFRVEGILISPNPGDNTQYLRAKSSAGFQNIDGSQTYINTYYPTNYYSPVIVLRDKDYTAGSALHYPYLDYKYKVRSNLTLVNNQNSPRYNTWSHTYRDFATEPDGNAMIPALNMQQYTVSLRFSNQRNWIFTLYPYKQYFESLYGESSGNIFDRDLTPVLGIQLGDGGLANPGNPRGYRGVNAGIGRIDYWGWGNFTDWFIQRALDNNYQRVLIWTPGGVFNESRDLNYPPQYMSDWVLNASNSDGNFTKYAANDIELGFWWGRSTEIPVPVQWNPPALVEANRSNPAHIAFLTNELDIAESRGAKMIGLDAFTQMPVYQRYNWIDDMKSIAPGVNFTHESTGPDLLHRKMAQHADPESWGDINGPDLLSWYLNPGSEIYILGRGAYNSLAFMQDMYRWGYTPNPKDTFMDAEQVRQSLIPCFDGMDNDGDQYIDIYDLGCIDEGGLSEG